MNVQAPFYLLVETSGSNGDHDYAKLKVNMHRHFLASGRSRLLSVFLLIQDPVCHVAYSVGIELQVSFYSARLLFWSKVLCLLHD